MELHGRPGRRENAPQEGQIEEEYLMHMLKVAALTVSTAMVLLEPTLCFAAEKVIPHLVELVKEGGASMSANKKTLVDAKGNIVANEVDPKSVVKPTVEQKGNSAEQTPVINCNYRCAILTKRCFAEDAGAVVCINTCDKQTLICE
jgi:hypothetical protein